MVPYFTQALWVGAHGEVAVWHPGDTKPSHTIETSDVLDGLDVLPDLS